VQASELGAGLAELVGEAFALRVGYVARGILGLDGVVDERIEGVFLAEILKPLPDWTSTQQVPWVVKGLVPKTVPRRSRMVAERVAQSGIAEVSKETMDLWPPSR